jgi:hypothetical protein
VLKAIHLGPVVGRAIDFISVCPMFSFSNFELMLTSGIPVLLAISIKGPNKDASSGRFDAIWCPAFSPTSRHESNYFFVVRL